MRFHVIESAERLYDCATLEAPVVTLQASSSVLAQFHWSLREFERSLGDDAEAPDCALVKMLARRLRFEVMGAPVSPGFVVKLNAEGVQRLKDAANRLKHGYPRLGDRAARIVENLDELAADWTNPILESLEAANMLPLGQQSAMVLAAARLVDRYRGDPAVRRLLGGASVLSPRQLRGQQAYERMLFIGSPRWFSAAAFAAPRAPQLLVASYDVASFHFPNLPRFGELMPTNDSGRPEQTAQPPVVATTRSEAEVDDLLPRLDLSAVARQRSGQGSAPGAEVVQAILVRLDGDRGVLLEAGDTSSVLAIQIEADGKPLVTRILVRDIVPDDFVLLRDHGSEDYILPVADRILGLRARELREIQADWKSRVRLAVETRSHLDVALELLDLGSERANETNLRNWMSPRSIRTHDRNDFVALMRFAGLEVEEPAIWDAMAEIDRAHRQAGRVVRSALIKRVSSTNLADLEATGTMKFVLKEIGGEALVARRVLEVASESVRVVQAETGSLFTL